MKKITKILLAAAVVGILGLRNPNMAGKTLSLLIGCGIIASGVCYLVALFGLGRFEKRVKELV